MFIFFFTINYRAPLFNTKSNGTNVLNHSIAPHHQVLTPPFLLLLLTISGNEHVQ